MRAGGKSSQALGQSMVQLFCFLHNPKEKHGEVGSLTWTHRPSNIQPSLLYPHTWEPRLEECNFHLAQDIYGIICIDHRGIMMDDVHILIRRNTHTHILYICCIYIDTIVHNYVICIYIYMYTVYMVFHQFWMCMNLQIYSMHLHNSVCLHTNHWTSKEHLFHIHLGRSSRRTNLLEPLPVLVLGFTSTAVWYVSNA